MATMDLSTNQEVMGVQRRYDYPHHIFKQKETFEETDIQGNIHLFNTLKTEANSTHDHDSSSLLQVKCLNENKFEVDNALFSYSSFKKAMDLRTHNRTLDGVRRTIFDDAEYFAKNYRYKLLPITLEPVDETVIQFEHNYSLMSLNSESEPEENFSRTMDYSQIKEKNYKRRRTKFRDGSDVDEERVECDTNDIATNGLHFSPILHVEDESLTVEEEQNASLNLEIDNSVALQPLDLSAAPLVQEKKTDSHLRESPSSIVENEEVAQLDSDKENLNSELSGILVTITRPDEKENYQPCDLFLNDIARLVPRLIDKDCLEVDILDRTCDRQDEFRKHRLYYVIAESTWRLFQRTNERVILTNDKSLGQPIRREEENERPSYLVFDQFSLAKCLADYCQEIGGCFEYTCVEEGKQEDCLREEGKKGRIDFPEGRQEDCLREEGRKEDCLREEGRQEDWLRGEGRQEDCLREEGRKEDSLREERRQEDCLREGRQEDWLREGRQEDWLRDEGRQEDSLREEGRQEDSLREEGRQEDWLREEGRQEDSLKEEGRQEDCLREEGRQEDCLREEGRQENSLREEGEETAKEVTEPEKEIQEVEGEVEEEKEIVDVSQKESVEEKLGEVSQGRNDITDLVETEPEKLTENVKETKQDSSELQDAAQKESAHAKEEKATEAGVPPPEPVENGPEKADETKDKPPDPDRKTKHKETETPKQIKPETAINKGKDNTKTQSKGTKRKRKSSIQPKPKNSRTTPRLRSAPESETSQKSDKPVSRKGRREPIHTSEEPPNKLTKPSVPEEPYRKTRSGKVLQEVKTNKPTAKKKETAGLKKGKKVESKTRGQKITKVEEKKTEESGRSLRSHKTTQWKEKVQVWSKTKGRKR